jgi:hypothetical protein
MDGVLGHYISASGPGLGKAVASWSTPLFNAVTQQDDLRELEQLVAPDALAGGVIACVDAGATMGACCGALLANSPRHTAPAPR